MKTMIEIGKALLAMLLAAGILIMADGFVPKSKPTGSPWSEFMLGLIVCLVTGLPLLVTARKERAEKRDANHTSEGIVGNRAKPSK